MDRIPGRGRESGSKRPGRGRTVGAAFRLSGVKGVGREPTRQAAKFVWFIHPVKESVMCGYGKSQYLRTIWWRMQSEKQNSRFTCLLSALRSPRLTRHSPLATISPSPPESDWFRDTRPGSASVLHRMKHRACNRGRGEC